MRDTNHDTTNLATINSSTGELTPMSVGTVCVGVSCSGSGWVWYKTVTIKYAGCQPMRNITAGSPESNSINCHGYACILDYTPYRTTWCPDTVYNNLLNNCSTSNEYLYGIHTNNTCILGIKYYLECWLGQEFENRWEEVYSSNGGWDIDLESNQWLIVFRVGFYDRNDKDYHFWYRTNEGYWSNKHGTGGPSEPLADLPTNNNSNGWKLFGSQYYNSDVIYYVLTEATP